jgi:hypothetical protein
MPNSLLKLDVLGLYRQFIVRKYDIYQEEKFQVNMNNVVAVGRQEHDLKKHDRGSSVASLEDAVHRGTSDTVSKRQRMFISKRRFHKDWDSSSKP